MYFLLNLKKKLHTFTIIIWIQLQLEFQHSQEYAGITLALGMTPSPIVEISGVLGTEGLVIGGELAIDHTRGISLNKYNAGIGFTRPDFNASIILYVNCNPQLAHYILLLLVLVLFISIFYFKNLEIIYTNTIFVKNSLLI